MKPHSFARAATIFTGLIVCSIMLVEISAIARAQTQPAAEHTVYLPLLRRDGTPDQTPPPAKPQGGFFTLRDYLTYNGDIAIDASGGMHIAFNVSDEKHEDNPPGSPALYSYCPGPTTNCADGAKWSDLVSLAGKVNQVQIAVTPDGQPRMLVRRDREGTNWDDYIYFACDQNCTDQANWAGLLVVQPAGLEYSGYSNPQHSFTLDALGRPRFIYANGWGNGKTIALYYAACDAQDCTEPGSWSFNPMLYGPEFQSLSADYASLVFDGTRPRVLVRTLLSGLPDQVYYFACDEEECYQDFHWTKVAIRHPEGKAWANWDLALDALGRPRVALYEAAPIDITVGGKLYYGWCDADCTTESAWKLTHVASGEGVSVDLAIDDAERVHLVYDAGQRGVLAELWCDTDCGNPNSWQRRILETNDQLMKEFTPTNPLTCDADSRVWLDAIPAVAFDPAGRLVIAYDVKHVARCFYSDPTKPDNPPGSRVERLWRAVRFTYAERP